ncbi:hypothetical protein OPQ81_003210 [Rhizoctonia solani]|nr:hypothetical protein OPQ81_003210 [Rhizoctonia solani]
MHFTVLGDISAFLKSPGTQTSNLDSSSTTHPSLFIDHSPTSHPEIRHHIPFRRDYEHRECAHSCHLRGIGFEYHPVSIQLI